MQVCSLGIKTELLQHEKSYCISDGFLKRFNEKKFISIGQNSEITQIDDMTNVIDDELSSLNIGRTSGEVVYVVTIDTYRSCQNCNAKVMEEDSVVIATCSKCNSKMKIAKCPSHSIANVILHDEQNQSY